MDEIGGGRKAWTAVVMVFLFMVINFADKAVMGLSSTSIIKELGLTNAQFGALGSSFFLLFSVSGILVGFLANRVKTKTIMAAMSIVWALSLLPMVGSVTYLVLLTSRVALGAAEGPAFPVSLHAVYKWFGDKRRAVPTSVVACGAAFGTGVVAPLITWMIVRYGWHAAFAVLGALGFVWAVVWLVIGEDGPLGRFPAATNTFARIPYRRLLLSRTALGVFVGGFAAYWIIALNIVWLANYLVKGLHLDLSSASWIVVLPSATQMLLAPCLAFLSQRMTKAGYASRYSRGLLGSVCVVLAGVSMVSLPLVPLGALKIALIALSFSLGSVIFTLGSTLIAEICPSSQRGAMLGITNSIHTLAGLVAPVAMGLVVDVGANPAAGFRAGFINAGILVAALGALAAYLINPDADLRRFKRAGLDVGGIAAGTTASSNPASAS
jgi:sugar phosphate permease